MKRKNLICIGSDGGGALRDEEGTFARFSTGVLVNLLALDYEKVVWCAPRSQEGREQRAVKLADNVKFVESPEFCANLPQTLIRRERFRDSWRNALSEPGDVFMFGRFPAVGDLYDLCAELDCKTLHWLFNNPFALINASNRSAVAKKLALFNATQWENAVKRGVSKTQGAFLCSGQEIYNRMDGFDRYEEVAAPIQESDFAWRDDVCQGETIRALFVGDIQPQNGIESFVEAIPLLKTNRKVELICVADKDQSDPKYDALLRKIVRDNRLQDRVSFLDYVDRETLLETMRESDLFVFPAIAADAPYVVVEARSQGLPTIASDVGGLPSSINDGVDGLLVPPGDPAMIADAIDCVVEDDELRRDLIAEGYASAQHMTFDELAISIVEIFDKMNGRECDDEAEESADENDVAASFEST